jgi:ankyrin repeat protein
MLLLSSECSGNAALYWAAFNGKPDVLQKIWDMAKGILTTEEIKNKLLSSTDIYGRRALHWAALSGKTNTLQKLFDVAKDILTTDEIKN